MPFNTDIIAEITVFNKKRKQKYTLFNKKYISKITVFKKLNCV